MLSLAKAAKDYYLQKLGELSPREDYYLRGGAAIGTWRGSGAAELGLEGTVNAEELVRLFDGQHPETGEQLGRQLRKDGVAAWDVTFSADKSVSLLWALGDDETRRQVLEAFEDATAAAFEYLESVASATRGATRVAVLDDQGRPLVDEHGRSRHRVETWPIATTGYVAASFTEFTSRADDPQLHTHVVVANKVRGVDGVWRTIDGRLLYRHQLAAGYLHEAELRSRLTQRLGVRWQPVRKGMADIEGFTRTQIEAFSRRRQQLEAWRQEQGLADTAAAREVATLATRSPKRDQPLDRLLVEWWERAQGVGLTSAALALMMERSREATRPDPAGLFEALACPEGLTAGASTFGRAEAIRDIAAAFAEGGTRAEIEALADMFLESREVIRVLATPPTDVPEEVSIEGNNRVEVPLPSEDGPRPMRRGDGSLFPGLGHEPRYSTAELLRTEHQVVERAVTGVGAGRWRVPERLVAKVLGRHRHLTWGQREMVRRFATSGSAIDLGVGPAGSGKTAVMAVIGELAARTGTPILGAALAARAAAGLQAATGIASATLTRLVGETRDSGGFPRGAIVVVDEAAMVGTRQLAALCDLVETAQGKLILVGDHRQLPEIEAGGLFRALVTRLRAVELTDNVRQQEPWERGALAELRDGSVSRAIETYRQRRRIVYGAGPEDTVERALGDWYHHVAAPGDLEGTVLIAYRNATGAELNTRARDLMARAGYLKGPALEVGERLFCAGDRVLCRKNRSGLGVLNGDLGTVVNVEPESGTLIVRLDRNGETRVLPTWYLGDGHLDHGYALTGHKAQGVTVRRCFSVLEGGADREWTYVTMSRGAEANTLYLTAPEPKDDECAHLAHRSPEVATALERIVGRTSAQTAGIDHGGHQPRYPEDLDLLGPPPPSHDVAARATWLVARRKITRDLDRQRQAERAAERRESPAIGIGR